MSEKENLDNNIEGSHAIIGRFLKLHPDSIINAMCTTAVDYPEISASILLELKN